MLYLTDFGISASRGFLAPCDMGEVTLPPAFEPIVQAAACLSAYMTADAVVHELRCLPEVNMADLLPGLTDPQLRLLMIRYSFLMQAYIWADQGQLKPTLPRNIAVPYCALAEAIGQYPLLPYSSYTLDNWTLIDPARPVEMDNIRTLQNFLGGQDENWFILIHVLIESRAAAILAEIPAVLNAVVGDDGEALKRSLQLICTVWESCNAAFSRMPEKCDPYIYYHRVRPYIHGLKNNPAFPNGLIYQGVEKYRGKPQCFCGQTGSQSSIVPVMDALLGIKHAPGPMRAFLDELHQYRPPQHRRFIDEVRRLSGVRGYVQEKAEQALTQAYDDCVGEVTRFRKRHLEFAATYINKQARDATGNPTDVGTGGTPFMAYLKKHQEETAQSVLGQ